MLPYLQQCAPDFRLTIELFACLCPRHNANTNAFARARLRLTHREREEVFFHSSEIYGGYDLKPGDEVEFIVQVNPRTKEKNARKIKFIKEGPPPAKTEAAEQKLSPRIVHERPASTQFQNNTKTQESRKPKGPDGTRGFVNAGRGKRVGPPNTVLEARIGQKPIPPVVLSGATAGTSANGRFDDAVTPPPAITGNVKLNVEAQPFVPLGMKQTR